MPGYQVNVGVPPNQSPKMLMFFYSKEDLAGFVEGVIKPNAEKFGLEITVKEKPAQKVETTRL